MSRIDQLEANLKEILEHTPDVLANLGDGAGSIFVRREMTHGARNLGKSPYVEIEAEMLSRQWLCDDADEVRCRVAIRITEDIKTIASNKGRNAADAIVAALYANENFNMPVDVGAINDWALSFDTENRKGDIRGTITIDLRLVVPLGEA